MHISLFRKDIPGQNLAGDVNEIDHLKSQLQEPLKKL